MNVPIDQLKEAIAYLEKKEMRHDSIPVFKWIIRERAVSFSVDPLDPFSTRPINELTFEYSFRYRTWELKL